MNQTDDVKIDYKTIGNPLKSRCGETLGNILKKHKLSDLGSHWGADCSIISSRGLSINDLVLGTALGAVVAKTRAPHGPILASPGAPLVQFSSLF